MSTPIVDQPPPIPTTTRPTWEVVIESVEKARERSAPDLDPVIRLLIKNGTPTTHDLMISDMRERHRIGIERYGAPLQHDNGRDHLVDAYQELLDAVVYLASDLLQRGMTLDRDPDAVAIAFHTTRNQALQLRAVIVQRTGR